MTTDISDGGLYRDVTRHQAGFYELKDRYRKDMHRFYAQEYYQDNHATYTGAYDAQELLYRENNYHEKCLILNDVWGGEKRHKGKSFLDIGCGEGFALKYFKRQGWDVTGADESRHGIRTHNPDMEQYLVQGDFYDLADGLIKSNRTFDFINADNVLEHVPDPVRFMSRVSGLCRDDTVVCISVPNDFSLIQQMAYDLGQIGEAFWVTTETCEHFNYFSVESLKELGRRAGFGLVTAASAFPVDLFLLHSASNYRKHDTGRECHRIHTELENRIHAISPEKTLELHKAMASLGIGRIVSLYFMKAES